MRQSKSYSAAELIEHINLGKNNDPSPIDFVGGCKNCFSYWGSGVRGSGGYSARGLTIPESVDFLVGPPACGRHGDIQLLSANLHHRYYRIPLTESDIVNGRGPAKVKETILEFLKEHHDEYKVVVIITTCIDAVLSTDYSGVGKAIEEEYGIRFVEITMTPYTDESIRPSTHELQESIYKALRQPKEAPAKLFNVVGNVANVRPDSEIRSAFAEAGWTFQNMLECKTLEEYDRLAAAEFNLLMDPRAHLAAKFMKKKFGTPYFPLYETINPDETLGFYKSVEEATGAKLPIERAYEAAKEAAKECAKTHANKELALGTTFDLDPLKLAIDFINLGFHVSHVFCNAVAKNDLTKLEELSRLAPDIKFWMGPNPDSISFIENPLEADLAIGMMPLYFMRSARTKMFSTAQEPYDFAGQVNLFEKLDESLSQEGFGGGFPAGASDSPYARNWGVFEGRLL